MARLEVKDTVIRALYSKAAGRCSKCKNALWKEASDGRLFSIGITAHICAAEAGGPRHDTNLSDEDARCYPNLILLCSPCHTEVDNDVSLYSVAKILEIKNGHEQWVCDQLAESISTIGYPELDVIVTYIKDTETTEVTEDYSILDIKSKIQRNDLSASTERLIQMGLTQGNTIADYLNRFPDPDYANRLRKIFIGKYQEIREEGTDGDEAFSAMVEFVKGPNSEVKRCAAAIALVTYFFERCDIFEK